MTRSISLTRRLFQKPVEGSVVLSAAPRAVKGNVADILIAAEWVVNGNGCALPIEIVFKLSNRVLAPSPP